MIIERRRRNPSTSTSHFCLHDLVHDAIPPPLPHPAHPSTRVPSQALTAHSPPAFPFSSRGALRAKRGPHPMRTTALRVCAALCCGTRTCRGVSANRSSNARRRDGQVSPNAAQARSGGYPPHARLSQADHTWNGGARHPTAILGPRPSPLPCASPSIRPSTHAQAHAHVLVTARPALPPLGTHGRPRGEMAAARWPRGRGGSPGVPSEAAAASRAHTHPSRSPQPPVSPPPHHSSPHPPLDPEPCALPHVSHRPIGAAFLTATYRRRCAPRRSSLPHIEGGVPLGSGGAWPWRVRRERPVGGETNSVVVVGAVRGRRRRMRRWRRRRRRRMVWVVVDGVVSRRWRRRDVCGGRSVRLDVREVGHCRRRRGVGRRLRWRWRSCRIGMRHEWIGGHGG